MDSSGVCCMSSTFYCIWYVEACSVKSVLFRLISNTHSHMHTARYRLRTMGMPQPSSVCRHSAYYCALVENKDGDNIVEYNMCAAGSAD